MYTLADTVVTVPEVLKEVRDSKARHFLASLPNEITAISPSAESLKRVCDFARLTGDFSSLSITDLKVIALAYQMDVEEKGSSDHIRSAVETPEVVDKPANNNFFNPKEGTEQDAETIGVGAWEETDTESGWITPANVAEYTDMFVATDTKSTEPNLYVACLTGDFAMQNTILQMNLNLWSLEGLRIKKAKRWVKRCYGCFRLHLNMQEEFCSFCGQHTLQKISYEVDQDGSVVYNVPRKARNLRGTKYAIPKPKGGRHQDLIVTQGQVRRTRQKKAGFDLDEIDDEYFNLTKVGAKSNTQTFGYGRHNPNQARRKFGKKNKSKRKD
eukprot:TRINITY_DN7381_c0_g1_i1.p1 TRINITY_DN7381_c0_g1~~TRINITY_DN7381_c0_g1_i1.p1  ORF type:complete len:361 (+),score=80.40 TRINITY_DN7381_c0_g1_i1:103-1083(+)